MVDRAESLLKGKDVEYYKWAVYEVEVSKDHTVTLGEFDSSKALKIATLVQKINGANVTNDISNNVITVTGEGTNMDCILFVFGVKA